MKRLLLPRVENKLDQKEATILSSVCKIAEKASFSELGKPVVAWSMVARELGSLDGFDKRFKW